MDLRNAVLVGHSTGGGEVAHYIGRHGTSRVAKAVLVGAVPPLMLQTETNPQGTPLAIFDGIRTGVFDNRSQFYTDLTIAHRVEAAIAAGYAGARIAARGRGRLRRGTAQLPLHSA